MTNKVKVRKTAALILALAVVLAFLAPGFVTSASAEDGLPPFQAVVTQTGDTASVSIKSTEAFSYATLELKFLEELPDGLVCTGITDGADIEAYQPSEAANISLVNGLYAIDIDVAHLDENVEVPAGKELAVYTFDLSGAADGTYRVSFEFSAASDINGDPLDWQKGSVAATIVVGEVPGYTVSGTAVSWNGTADARYYLYAAEEENASIKTDIYLDTPVHALYTGTGGSVTANADGKRFDQAFTFATVPDGTYKLAIAKPGKYVPKIVQITVSGGNLDVGDVLLWLYGDVNYDGKIRTGDATQIYRLLAGERTFTDDEFSAADITGDGKIRTGDATQIYKWLAGESSAFDDFV